MKRTWLVTLAVAGLSLAARRAPAQGIGPTEAELPEGEPLPPVPPPAATTPPTPAPPPPSATARGLLLQLRFPSLSALTGVSARPGLAGLGALTPGVDVIVGYRAARFSLGLEAGMIVTGWNADGTAVSSLQFAPSAFLVVWQSVDGANEMDVAASLRIGWNTITVAAGSATNLFAGPNVGVGGNHFFSRNFAVGAEAGVDAIFTWGTGSGPTLPGLGSSTPAYGLSIYGLLRATVVVGR